MNAEWIFLVFLSLLRLQSESQYQYHSDTLNNLWRTWQKPKYLSLITCCFIITVKLYTILVFINYIFWCLFPRNGNIVPPAMWQPNCCTFIFSNNKYTALVNSPTCCENLQSIVQSHVTGLQCVCLKLKAEDSENYNYSKTNQSVLNLWSLAWSNAEIVTSLNLHFTMLHWF